MDLVTRLDELRAKRARLPGPVGFVPTMGALHGGHASLVERARAQSASVVASVFVNPLQFGPGEDYRAYPRDADADRTTLEQLGVDILFQPDANEIYARPPDIVVEPSALGRHFEGARRPGHFRGVATIVLKLFHLVRPDRASFGEMDAQQLAVIRRMVADLDLDLAIVACPTVRDRDGLASSSRNAFLSDAERRAAPNLHAALATMADALREGSGDVEAAVARARERLGPLREDYLGVVRPEEFAPLRLAEPGAELLAVGAAYAGTTRLIDNVKMLMPARPESRR